MTASKPSNGVKARNDQVHYSSADIVHLEHEHGAHNYHPLPVVFEKAKGALVWDPEGREYIDMLSAYSAVNQGHCHPRIVATLIAQSQKLTLSSRAFYNSNFGPFAKKATELFGYEMILPMNTGAEAVETGLKLARKWAYKKKGVKEGEAIILGKALSGGVYPVSAVLSSKDIMLCISPGEHGSTYGGNPLGCAVASTALDVLVDEKLAERAERLGRLFRDSIEAFKKEGGARGRLIREVRGRGLLNAVVIDEEQSEKGRTAWQFCLLLKSRGVLAKPTHVNIIRFAPPLVIEEEDLKKAIRIIGQSLEDLDKLDVIPGDEASEVGHKDNVTL